MCLSKFNKINYGKQILLFTVPMHPPIHDEDDDCSFF